jgi:2-polyprenyl-3-methyl-5-hydroxy-6-metoxy-1,4-benzoquinol methylase
MENGNDLYEKDHWDSFWTFSKPKFFNKQNYYNSVMDTYFRKYVREGSVLLEVGCGGSVWLPYFKKHLGCEIWGIDYSEQGLLLSTKNLESLNLSGHIIQGDIFRENDLPDSNFDVIWSNGFIEHFNDPGVAVNAFIKYMKPDSIIITMVPNMTGLVGIIQKFVDKATYDAHKKITTKMLDNYHISKGLVAQCKAQYFGTFSIGVVNYSSIAQKSKWLHFFITKFSSIFQQLILIPFKILNIQVNSKFFSPYVIAVYKKVE